MNFDWLLCAVLFAFLLIGTVRAIFKPWLKNILRLATVPIAFLLAFLLQVTGVIGLIGNAVASAINLAKIVKLGSADADVLINAVAGSFISTIIFVFFFILFLVLLRCLAVRFIAKLIVKEGDEDQKIGFSILSGVCGALSGFLILGVVLMPLFYATDLAVSAVSVVREDKEHTDSSIYAAIKVVDDDVVTPLEKGIAAGAYKYTGVSYVMKSTAAMNGKFTTASGKKTTSDKVLRNVFENGIPVVIMLQSNKGDDSALPEKLDAILEDELVVSVVADVAKSSVSKLHPAEDAEASLTNELMKVLADHYKDTSKEQMEIDIKEISDLIVYLNDEKLIADLLDKESRKDTITFMLSDRAVLTETVHGISGASVFDGIVSSLYGYELNTLNGVLGIPVDDADAYDTLVNNILAALNDNSVGDFDMEKVGKFVVDFAESGRKITSIVDNADERNLYQNWKRYEKVWTRVQVAFSASCDDKTFGYIWYVGPEGLDYSFDVDSYTWEQTNNIDKKHATSAPLCQYLVICALEDKYDSEGNSTGKIITKDDLMSYLKEYGAWLDKHPECSRDTLSLAQRLLNRDTFVSNGVTLERMIDQTHFETWTEDSRNEDVEPLVGIVMDINAISDALKKNNGDSDQPFIVKFMDTFDLLGETLDIIKETHCMNDIAPLLLEGLLHDESVSSYLSSGVVHELNEMVDNKDMTYSSFMKTLKSMLVLVVEKD